MLPSRMRPFVSVAIAAALTTLASTADAGAQSSTTRGFLIGAHLGGGAVSIEGSDYARGGGGGVTFGLGVNRNFTVFLNLDGSAIDVAADGGTVEGEWTLGHADLGVRFNFANSLRSWVPYLSGALTARAVSIADIGGNTGTEGSISGGGFTLGGGIMIYPSQAFAVDISALFTQGQYTTLTVGGTSQTGFDVDSSSNRLSVGIAWWP